MTADFLMEQMEWREAVMEARNGGDHHELERLLNVFKPETERLVQVYKLTEGQIAPGMGVNGLYFAHSKDGLDQTEWQCLKDHLVNTANLAAEFGRDAGVSELARVAGLMHDIGKYS